MIRWPRLLPRSLVGRVFALYTITLLAFVVAGLGLFYRYQFAVALEYEQQRTDGLSRVITPSISDAAVIGDYDTILKTLERTVDQSNLASASFIDLNGGLIRATHARDSDIEPPSWLVDKIAAELYDNNQAIRVGGHDYGVLRLTFDAELIAGRLWEQIRFALLLGLVSIVGGLVLIRLPLVRWLGNLSRIQAFEKALQSGNATPAMLAAENAPSEFRQTFEILSRAAASLRTEREQASVTLSAITDAVLTLDPEGRVVLANPAAGQLLGRSANDMLGQPAADLLPELFEHTATLQPWRERHSIIPHGPGRPQVIDSSLSPILSPQRETVGYVLACRDVSEQYALDQRLRAELQSRETAMVSLRQVLEGLTTGSGPALSHVTDDLEAISAMISTLVTRLQARGEQLNAIFALSPDGFASFDATRCVNYVSPAFGRLTGLSDQQVLGATERDVEDMLHRQCLPDAPWRSFEAIRFELRQPQGPGSSGRRELIELVRPVKRVLEVGLRESTSETISQVLSLRDVTHETEVDQMKSEFLTTAAHELRTPMTSIFGFTELMLHRELKPEQQRQIVATIHRQSELMISIINELLDLARIEARRGTDFVLEDVDLCTLTQGLLHDFKPPNGRPSPVGEYPAEPTPVRVDRKKALQAIGNVVSNAYKYSPSGGEVRVRIFHDLTAVPPRVGLEVRDQGIGMTPEQLARVGERFYRADESGTIPGTGLGVSIVKEIIELLGGRMTLESTLGRGTTVTLWLPLLQHAPSGPHP